MKTIHKFRLKTGAQANKLRLRQGSRIVRSEYVLAEKAVFVWVEVQLDISVPEEEMLLRVFRTGEAIPNAYEYLTTAIDSFGPEAYHIYWNKVAQAQLEESA